MPKRWTTHGGFGRGDAFVAAIDETMSRIAEMPAMFPVLYVDVRRALVRHFPYAVFFVVEPASIVVLAVHHQRRDPAARPSR